MFSDLCDPRLASTPREVSELAWLICRSHFRVPACIAQLVVFLPLLERIVDINDGVIELHGAQQLLQPYATLWHTHAKLPPAPSVAQGHNAAEAVAATRVPLVSSRGGLEIRKHPGDRRNDGTVRFRTQVRVTAAKHLPCMWQLPPLLACAKQRMSPMSPGPLVSECTELPGLSGTHQIWKCHIIQMSCTGFSRIARTLATLCPLHHKGHQPRAVRLQSKLPPTAPCTGTNKKSEQQNCHSFN